MATFIVGRELISGHRAIFIALPKTLSTSVRPFSTNEDPKPLETTNLSALKRGRGGRSSFSGVVATVFGASGLLGRHVVNRLGKMGTQVIIPYRGDHSDVLRLKLSGDLGQILYHPFYLRDEESLRKAMRYSNVVINLIGRNFETRNFSYDDVHVTGARTIARIARELGVQKFIHVSSLNVDEKTGPGVILKGGSRFLSSKWAGEKAVREEFPNAIIFRPAEMFGSEDQYTTYYAHRYRREMRYLPMWNKGEGIIKQPVCAVDVSKGIVNAIFDRETDGKTYQAVGAHRYELAELVDWFYKVMRKTGEWGYKRIDMKYALMFRLRVTLTDKFSPSWPILIWDKIEREHTTDIVDRRLPKLQDLGVKLTSLEDYVPWLLRPYRAYAYYNEELGEFPEPPPPKIITTRDVPQIKAL